MQFSFLWVLSTLLLVTYIEAMPTDVDTCAKSNDITTSATPTEITTNAKPADITTTAKPTEITSAKPTEITTSSIPTDITTTAESTEITSEITPIDTTRNKFWYDKRKKTAKPTEITESASPTEITESAQPTEITASEIPIALPLIARREKKQGSGNINKWWEQVSTSYPKYDDTTQLLNGLMEAYPDLVNIYSAGKTVQGREMWVINLRANIQQPRKLLQPPMKIVANMHGDETVGRAVVLMLAVDMVKRFTENDPRVVQILSSTDVHLMPSVNPDGFEAAEEGCDNPPKQLGRRNANIVDLNRNFPDLFHVNVNDNSAMFKNREPETLNMMKFISNNDFVLSANLHGGFLTTSYPYDSVPQSVEKNADYHKKQAGVASLSPDNDVFVHLAKLYASNHKTMTNVELQCEKGGKFPKGITNGAEWYNVRGGMQDFNYWHSNGFEITMELSCCKYPAASTLLTEWDNNNESLYKYIEATHMGIRGLVKDTDGNPVEGAEIIIDKVNHTVRTTKRGEFWRLLMPGMYKVGVSAERFELSKIVDIEVGPTPDSQKPIILNFTLTPSEASSSDESDESNESSSLEDGVDHSKLTLSVGATRKSDWSAIKDAGKVENSKSNYEEIKKFLIYMSKEYPRITRLYSVGRSAKNKEFLALEISSNPGAYGHGQPDYTYVGNLNGANKVGREKLIMLTQYLLTNYMKMAEITHLINNAHIHIFPAMNPDNYELSEENEDSYAQENGHHLDRISNYPDDYEQSEENSEFESRTTRSVTLMINQSPFVLSSNSHRSPINADYPVRITG